MDDCRPHLPPDPCECHFLSRGNRHCPDWCRCATQHHPLENRNDAVLLRDEAQGRLAIWRGTGCRAGPGPTRHGRPTHLSRIAQMAASPPRERGLCKAPARLAEPSSLAKSKSCLGRHAVDENLCSPNGVTESGPCSIGCDEMRSVLRLICAGDSSKLSMVAHTFGSAFNHEVEPVEGALPRCKHATAVFRKVLRFPLPRPSTEVESPVEPDPQQGRHMRTTVRSNRREPIDLSTGQLFPSLRPLRWCCIHAAEGAQLGHRN